MLFGKVEFGTSYVCPTVERVRQAPALSRLPHGRTYERLADSRDQLLPGWQVIFVARHVRPMTKCGHRAPAPSALSYTWTCEIVDEGRGPLIPDC
jgi:hypothetical protein